jgi:hypothetical protein
LIVRTRYRPTVAEKIGQVAFLAGCLIGAGVGFPLGVLFAQLMHWIPTPL